MLRPTPNMSVLCKAVRCVCLYVCLSVSFSLSLSLCPGYRARRGHPRPGSCPSSNSHGVISLSLHLFLSRSLALFSPWRQSPRSFGSAGWPDGWRIVRAAVHSCLLCVGWARICYSSFLAFLSSCCCHQNRRRRRCSRRYAYFSFA